MGGGNGLLIYAPKFVCIQFQGVPHLWNLLMSFSGLSWISIKVFKFKEETEVFEMEGECRKGASEAKK